MTITTAADPWLDAVTTETLLSYGTRDGKPTDYTLGSLLLRNIYHYWYHTGENAAIRQHWVTPICQTSSAISMTKHPTVPE